MQGYHNGTDLPIRSALPEPSLETRRMADLREAFMEILDDELGHCAPPARVKLCDQIMDFIQRTRKSPQTLGRTSWDRLALWTSGSELYRDSYPLRSEDLDDLLWELRMIETPEMERYGLRVSDIAYMENQIKPEIFELRAMSPATLARILKGIMMYFGRTRK